ncbi:Cyp6a9 [Trypoxylus dichotomus]
MTLSGKVLVDIFIIPVSLLVITITIFKKRYSYWKNVGVEYLEPSIPFGNFKEVIRQKLAIGEFSVQYYNVMKARKAKHTGCYFFHRPIYVPMDLDLVKRILQTDFNHFTDHGGYVNEIDDPLSATVFNLDGQRWKKLRTKLTPTFTSGKMKLMFPIMIQLSEGLVKTLQEDSRKNIVDIKDISARFTTDVIGNFVFGIDCNSLKDPNTEFRVQSKRIFNASTFEMLKRLLGFAFPNVMRFFRARALPKDAADFFWKIIAQTAEHRQKNGIRRNDLFQLLLDMTDGEGKGNDTKLTFSELAAQVFAFFVAGFETSSTLMSFALLELSINEDVQKRLRDEVNEAFQKNNGELTYEALSEMRYLDMVINETLRKHPPVPNLSRVCTKNYSIPDSNVVIYKGDMVSIPITGIHYDSEYYPQPEKFDPTRFTEENKRKRHHFAFLPFGEGPRICLGFRFGLMQTKVGLALLIKNFNFKLNSRTKQPIKLDPKHVFRSALGGLWLDVEEIDNK